MHSRLRGTHPHGATFAVLHAAGQSTARPQSRFQAGQRTATAAPPAARPLASAVTARRARPRRGCSCMQVTHELSPDTPAAAVGITAKTDARNYRASLPPPAAATGEPACPSGSFLALALSAVDLAEHEVHGTLRVSARREFSRVASEGAGARHSTTTHDDGDHVGQPRATGHEVGTREVRKAGRADLAPVRAAGGRGRGPSEEGSASAFPGDNDTPGRKGEERTGSSRPRRDRRPSPPWAPRWPSRSRRAGPSSPRRRA